MTDPTTAARDALLDWLGPCENYTRSDCRGNGRGPRDSRYGAERWCAPCEVRDRLDALIAQVEAETRAGLVSVEARMRTALEQVFAPRPAPNVPGCTCDRDNEDTDTPFPFCPKHEQRLRPLRWETLALLLIDHEALLEQMIEVAAAGLGLPGVPIDLAAETPPTTEPHAACTEANCDHPGADHPSQTPPTDAGERCARCNRPESDPEHQKAVAKTGAPYEGHVFRLARPAPVTEDTLAAALRDILREYVYQPFGAPEAKEVHAAILAAIRETPR